MRTGGEWGADECPTGYVPIQNASTCAAAAAALGLADATVDELADVDGAPQGCLRFLHSAELELPDAADSLVFAHGDAESALSCRGCVVLCELAFREACGSAPSYNPATCADSDGDGASRDPSPSYIR